MSNDIESYENNPELALFREYRDVIGLFKYVVETERRFYLCNHVDVQARPVGGDIFFELTLTDAWVWDIFLRVSFTLSALLPTRTSTSRSLTSLNFLLLKDGIARFRRRNLASYCCSGNSFIHRVTSERRFPQIPRPT